MTILYAAPLARPPTELAIASFMFALLSATEHDYPPAIAWSYFGIVTCCAAQRETRCWS